MNQKIIVALCFAVIGMSALHITIIFTTQNDVKKLDDFELDSDQGLSLVAESLANRMWEDQIFLEMKDVHRLITSDPEVSIIRLYPNDVVGISGGKTTWSDKYALHSDTADGTRTYEVFSNNGTLLKSIKIYDEREKEILIILK